MPLSFFAIVPDSNANLPLVIAIINDGSSEILSNFSTRNSESLCKVKIELSIKETTIEEFEPILFTLDKMMKLFEFGDEINENMPNTSSLGEKSSDVVGLIKFSPNNFFKSNYNFSLDNNLDVLKYNSLDAQFTVNNFITSFKYLEENDNIGDENYIQNDTSFQFNENSSIGFSVRKNKKIDLTEYYNLIYQYKNDCLTAAIKYKKDFYVDNDLKPTEQLFFSLTIVPLGAYESTNIISKYGKYILE